MNLDKEAYDYIADIKRILSSYFPENYEGVFQGSSFLARLRENPAYVYHYEAKYWADMIRSEFLNGRQRG